jgi:hypothetical protein
MQDARIDPGLEELVPDAHGVVTIEDDQRAAQRVAAGDFAWTRRDVTALAARARRRARGGLAPLGLSH